MSDKDEVTREPIVETCDHRGHWKAGGMVPINAPNNTGLFLAQIIFCGRCGHNSVQLHSIVANPTAAKAPDIAKP